MTNSGVWGSRGVFQRVLPQLVLRISATRFAGSRSLFGKSCNAFRSSTQPVLVGFRITFRESRRSNITEITASKQIIIIKRKLSFTVKCNQFFQWHLYAPLPVMAKQNLVIFNSIKLLDSTNFVHWCTAVSQFS